MQEREIKFEEVQVGDVVRLVDNYCGVVSTAQGEVRSLANGTLYMGDVAGYSIRGSELQRRNRKAILVSRPPKETPIKPEDIELGMWVRINGAEAKRVIGFALFKDFLGVEHIEFHLSIDGWRSRPTFVDIGDIQTAIVVDAPTA